MSWLGQERRGKTERRVVERRRTMRYDAHTLLIIDGRTWIDSEGGERRRKVRRNADRYALATKFLQHSRP